VDGRTEENTMSMADEIQKLEELRKSGALTDEEFNKAKAALLAGGGAPPPSSPPPPAGTPLPAKSPEEQTKMWAMFLHLSLLAGLVVPYAGFVAPIVIWQVKKADLPGLDAHGKNAVNFILSMLIYSVVAGVLSCIGIGVLLFIPLILVGIIFPVIAGLKANNGEVWKYPVSIPFLK
jgi:uncharacterized protein